MSEMSVNPAGAKQTGQLLRELGSDTDNIKSDFESTVDTGGSNPFYGNDAYGDAFAANWSPLASAVSAALGGIASSAPNNGEMSEDTGGLYSATDDVNSELPDAIR